MTVLVPGARNILVVAGLVLPMRGLKVLRTHVTSSSWSVFFDNSFDQTAAVYQVPSGKTFNLRAYRWQQYSASSATAGASLAYGDASLGVNSGSAMTNPINIASGAAGLTLNDAPSVISEEVIAGSTVLKEGIIGGRVVALKYLHLLVNNAFGQMTVFGYEI